MEVLQNLIHQTAFANNTLDWRHDLCGIPLFVPCD